MKKLLTPLELKIMNILWEIKQGFVKDILDRWEADEDDETPKYQTVSTIIRILQDKKQFIGHRAYGRTHEYFPLITKEAYQQLFMRNALENVFAGSLKSLVSTLVDTDVIATDELDELKKLIDNA